MSSHFLRGEKKKAVGYGGDGATCSFQPYINAMPAIFKDGWLIAASQDVYNGFHLPDDWSVTPRSPLTPVCDWDGVRFTEADFSKMCGQGCGECYQISGPAGSQTFIVNEIADIGAIGISGQGVNMNLGTGAGGNGNPAPAPCRAVQGGDCNRKVLDYQGPTAIVMKKVPCPVEGNIQLGIRGFGTTPLSGSNVEMTPLHFRLGIVSMWVRGRDSSEQPTAWKWVPRTWTNKFLFEPGVGLNGAVFDQSPSKTFDVRFQASLGTTQITCGPVVWAPADLGSSRGLQGLGTCQFADPAIDVTPCPAALPPNPIIDEQFYSRNGGVDCPSLNSQTGGCSVKTEGAYLLEWRDWGSFGFSPFPNYGFTADCVRGTRCIDTTLSTSSAAVQLGWTQKISMSDLPSNSSVHFWAKCMSGATCAGVTLGINNPCALISSAPVTVTDTWSEYVISLDALAACAAFNVVRISMPTGRRLLLDEMTLYCGAAPCPSAGAFPPTSGPSGGSNTCFHTSSIITYKGKAHTLEDLRRNLECAIPHTVLRRGLAITTTCSPLAVRVTDGHLLESPSGFVRADSIQAGDILVSGESPSCRVLSVIREHADQPYFGLNCLESVVTVAGVRASTFGNFHLIPSLWMRYAGRIFGIKIASNIGDAFANIFHRVSPA